MQLDSETIFRSKTVVEESLCELAVEMFQSHFRHTGQWPNDSSVMDTLSMLRLPSQPTA